MNEFTDAFIKEWGDRVYVKRTPGKKVSKHRGLNPTYHSKNTFPQKVDYRKALNRISNKTPEVMVKISGKGKGMRHIAEHINYISRNGKVDIEDERGVSHFGAKSIKIVKSEWANKGYKIPEESNKRETFNIVLSMPPGTNRSSVKNAAREFASQEFSGHKYVFAAHDDQDHPHVHICVKAVDEYGMRLNPRKADLVRWREGFAQKMRENGIECNASSRRVRAVERTPDKQVIIHMKKKGTIRKQKDTTGFEKNIVSDYSTKIVKSYQSLSTVLKKGSAEDVKLARDIDTFLKDKNIHVLHKNIEMDKEILKDTESLQK